MKTLNHEQISNINWLDKFNFTLMHTIDKGGIMSKDIGGLLFLQKNIPIKFFKLLYPVNGNNKILLFCIDYKLREYYSFKIKI